MLTKCQLLQFWKNTQFKQKTKQDYLLIGFQLLDAKLQRSI